MRVQNVILIVGVIVFTLFAGAWVVGEKFSISGNLFGETITGSGKIVSEVRTIPNSTSGIIKSSSFDVIIRQGNEAMVEVKADDNILPHVVTDIKDDMLVLHMENGYSYRNMKVSLEVVLPTCSQFIKSGSGDVEFDAFQFQEELSIVASGSGDIKCSGTAKDLSIKKSGSGRLNFKNCPSNYASIVSSGSGDIKLHVMEEISGVKSGSHDIHILGNPEINIQKSGSGNIKMK